MDGWKKLSVQIDFCSCLRCHLVQPAFFVFDDGTFYCRPCFDYLLGGKSIDDFGKEVILDEKNNA